MTRVKHSWGGVLCAILFFLLGLAFINQPGIEEDEATFATPFFRDWCFYSLPVGHHRLPLMDLSYAGSLKTWLYAPIFWLCPPSTAAIRIPALFLGSVTILLFWFFLERVHSRRAAIAGCVLLSTDTVFLLTTTFDWGPVVLQHLLATAAMLLAVLWYRNGRERFLAAAAFCCGLAFWDKAVFGWMFAGLCAGSLIFVAGIWRRITFRGAALAMVALLAGALPIVIYNLGATPKFATVRLNAHFVTDLFPGVRMVRGTWNGDVLFGIVQDTAPVPNPPHSAVQRASFHLRSALGARNTNLIEPALIAALVLVPLLWRTPARKGILFSIVAAVFGCLVMLLSGGGLFAHHTILLWPLPAFFLAIAFGEVSRHVRFGRWLLSAAVGLLVATNLLVTNEYLYRYVRYGNTVTWTDALYPLAASLAKTHASQVVLPDWGIADQLCVLNRNDPQPHQIGFPFMPPGDLPAQREADLQVLSDEKAIWVEHTPGQEFFKGAHDRVFDAAKQAGFSAEMLGTYYDRNGRAVFQTFRFSPVR
jgi:hypothetical protein